jgi:hypothetical protein
MRCRDATARGSGLIRAFNDPAFAALSAVGDQQVTDRFILRKRDAGIAMARESTFSDARLSESRASTRRIEDAHEIIA